jgi:hypothetical protein
LQHFQERRLFIDAIKQGKRGQYSQGEIDNLKRRIRGDLRKYKELNDDGYDSFEGRWIKGTVGKEEKIYYGSDSDEDVESFGDDEIPTEGQPVEELLKWWKAKNRGDKLVVSYDDTESEDSGESSEETISELEFDESNPETIDYDDDEEEKTEEVEESLNTSRTSS